MKRKKRRKDCWTSDQENGNNNGNDNDSNNNANNTNKIIN